MTRLMEGHVRPAPALGRETALRFEQKHLMRFSLALAAGAIESLGERWDLEMSDVSEKLVTIALAEGLHLRPADAFVSVAKQFDSEIEISKDAEKVDGKSILSIITLAAAQGDQLLIQARGPDAPQAIDALSALVEQNFKSAAEGSATNGDIQPTEENV